MSNVDPGQPTQPGQATEERINRAIAHGPDMDARGRFGKITRFARRIVGRAVKYERDFNLQIDVALLERIHEMEAAAAQQVRDAEARLNGTDDLLRYADEVLREADRQLREADHRIGNEVTELAQRFRALEASVDEMRSRLEDVDTRAAVASSVAAGAAEGFAELHQTLSRPSSDALALGDVNVMPSGSRKDLVGTLDGARRARVYLDIIDGRGPVVDLGCGSGEMLERFASAGIDVRGVDINETMVDRARAAGVDVSHDDALDFLMKQEDASLGAIFSAGLVEQLPADRLAELMEVAHGKLLPGGVFIAETTNPHSAGTLRAFWVDPTVHHPLFPESLLALCRLAGFGAAKIMFPDGSDDVATDFRTCGEYAVIAERRERP
ncbi:MAG TPA: class I SAM-dependent methyltransferase [Acidimicrobiia bacterium]|jgi:SAM-dependent methyltransferase|nr:class I SAM-dependent methyltransferase [Acidimicrobiia bacterium]